MGAMSESEVPGQELQFSALGIDWARTRSMFGACKLQVPRSEKTEKWSTRGSDRSLSGATRSTIRQSPDRAGSGTSEGSFGVHAQ